MTIDELLKVINPSTMIWIETKNEEHVYHSEAEDILSKYKAYKIKTIYPQNIKALYENCIVIQVNK